MIPKPRNDVLAAVFTIFVLVFAWGAINTCNEAGAVDAIHVKGDISFTCAGTEGPHYEKIDAFLQYYFRACNPRKLDNARAILRDVVDISDSENVNPYLVAAIIRHESSWNQTARGALGEAGLMQINNLPIQITEKWTIRDQITRGIGMLLDSYARCGSVLGAVSHYATGKSCRVYRGARIRVKLAQRMEQGFYDDKI
jgi:hypothetical protein